MYNDCTFCKHYCLFNIRTEQSRFSTLHSIAFNWNAKRASWATAPMMKSRIYMYTWHATVMLLMITHSGCRTSTGQFTMQTLKLYHGRIWPWRLPVYLIKNHDSLNCLSTMYQTEQICQIWSCIVVSTCVSCIMYTARQVSTGLKRSALHQASFALKGAHASLLNNTTGSRKWVYLIWTNIPKYTQIYRWLKLSLFCCTNTLQVVLWVDN